MRVLPPPVMQGVSVRSFVRSSVTWRIISDTTAQQANACGGRRLEKFTSRRRCRVGTFLARVRRNGYEDGGRVPGVHTGFLPM